jgi:hypothetical protein
MTPMQPLLHMARHFEMTPLPPLPGQLQWKPS